MVKSLLEYNSYYNQVYIACLVENKVKDERCLSLMSHILNAQHIWNSRVLSKPMPFAPWHVHEVSKLLSLNESGFSGSMEIMMQVDPVHVFTYENTKGQQFSNSVQDVMTHVANHGTYHRGQLAMRLKELGIQPPPSDYIIYKRSIDV